MKLSAVLRYAPNQVRETITTDTVAAGQQLIAWSDSIQELVGSEHRPHRQLKTAARQHGERLAAGAVVTKSLT